MPNQPPTPLRIAVVQCRILWNDISGNCQQIELYVQQLQGQADLIIFPETITTGFSAEAAQRADSQKGEVYTFLQKIASEYQVALAGSYLTEWDEGKVYNMFFLFDQEGKAQLQPKRHLFAPGGERAFVSPAMERTIFSFRGWRILPVICYDMRFPVWCRNMQNEYDLMICVANWPRPRRRVFSTLLRARAMENLCYTIGVNRVGADPQGLFYTGDSAVLNARGETLAEAKESQEEILLATLDYTPLSELRHKFPVWEDADSFTLHLN